MARLAPGNGSFMTTLDTRRTSLPLAVALRRLYLVRFGFAVVWALVLVLLAATLGPLSVALLLLYPASDLVAAVVDHRASRSTGLAPALVVNMALSLLAVVGLALAVTSGVRSCSSSGVPGRSWPGSYSSSSPSRRRALGGQLFMILSGGISVLAGVAFIVRSASPTASLTSLGGYAGLGGLFFLLSALRLQRRAPVDGR